MKTWEMIKELTENPGKGFKIKGENGIVYASDLYSEGKVELDQVDFITIYDEWEEVKEPVTFMKAVESGKEFVIEHKRMDRKKRTLRKFFKLLVEDYTIAEIQEILTQGKFYIEEEN